MSIYDRVVYHVGWDNRRGDFHIRELLYEDLIKEFATLIILPDAHEATPMCFIEYDSTNNTWDAFFWRETTTDDYIKQYVDSYDSELEAMDYVLRMAEIDYVTSEDSGEHFYTREDADNCRWLLEREELIV